MNAGAPDAVEVRSVRKVYGRGAAAVAALDDVTCTVGRGDFAAVMGPSGSGKSTFLNCAAGLDRPTGGRVLLGGTDLSELDETGLTMLRRERIGFVFQAYNLVEALDVTDNITLPLRLADRRVDRRWLAEIVAEVGLTDRARHRPAELSGGQRQRVAIARALITRPDVVFADEPTGALDSRSGRQVLELLRGCADTLGQTVVMVTHDPVAAAAARRVVFLADGRVAGHAAAPTPDQVTAAMNRLGAW